MTDETRAQQHAEVADGRHAAQAGCRWHAVLRKGGAEQDRYRVGHAQPGEGKADQRAAQGQGLSQYQAQQRNSGTADQQHAVAKTAGEPVANQSRTGHRQGEGAIGNARRRQRHVVHTL
ncbi:hypothetical protein D3C76_452570 [compost metagenome]